VCRRSYGRICRTLTAVIVRAHAFSIVLRLNIRPSARGNTKPPAARLGGVSSTARTVGRTSTSRTDRSVFGAPSTLDFASYPRVTCSLLAVKSGQFASCQRIACSSPGRSPQKTANSHTGRQVSGANIGDEFVPWFKARSAGSMNPPDPGFNG
jgi:hypothetical protein